MRKIAIISLPELQGFALQMLISEGETVEFRSFPSVATFLEQADKFDLYAIGIEAALQNIEYFIPKRSRTLVFSNGFSVEGDSFNVIHSDASMSEIRTKIEHFLKADAQKGEDALTVREVEVLRELAKGKTQKEIADTLFISLSTVITHRKNISAKLGIRSISGLSLYAAMNGII